MAESGRQAAQYCGDRHEEYLHGVVIHVLAKGGNLSARSLGI